MRTIEKDESLVYNNKIFVTCEQWSGAWEMVLTTLLVISLLCNVSTTCTSKPLLLLLLYSENSLLEIVHGTKLLGNIVRSDRLWHSNKEMLGIKAYKRMLMLHKLYAFNVDQEDMVLNYILFIRSILE